MATQGLTTIRMVTWLAPGLPLGLFERIRETLQQRQERPVSLESRTKLSGPEIGHSDPFANNQADVGFLCAPAAVPAALRQQAGFELLGIAPLFNDSRYANKPVCYCDIVVHADSAATCLADVQGMRFGYNDHASLSGWLGLSAELQLRGSSPQAFFRDCVHTGGHLSSLRALRTQTIQVASIDSNVLRSHPGALTGLKVIDSVGPWPAQPVVVRSGLDTRLKAQIKDLLSTCGPWPEWGFVGFRPQAEARLEGVPSTSDAKH